VRQDRVPGRAERAEDHPELLGANLDLARELHVPVKVGESGSKTLLYLPLSPGQAAFRELSIEAGDRAEPPP
jgi:hypothetical protein